jgi:hypothetical protein
MKKLLYVFGAFLSLSVMCSAEDIAVSVTPVPDTASSATSSIGVVHSALGTGVDRETRAIQGEAASFNASSEVYYLTRIKAETVPTTVNHVYSVDGREVASVSLAVKGSPWTTWSRKTVWAGAWKVELKDESGVVIESKEFTVSNDMLSPAAPVEPAASPVPEQPQ